MHIIYNKSHYQGQAFLVIFQIIKKSKSFHDMKQLTFFVCVFQFNSLWI